MGKRWTQYKQAGLICTLLLVLSSCAAEQVSRSPNVHFLTTQRQTIELQQLTNQAVLIVFWATTCRSCLQEIPELIQLYSRLHKHGLEIIAVAMPHDRPDRVVQLSRQFHIPYPVALDPLGEVNQQLGPVELTPTSILIDPQGIIQWRKQGRLNFTKLESQIRAML